MILSQRFDAAIRIAYSAFRMRMSLMKSSEHEQRFSNLAAAYAVKYPIY